MKYAYKNALAFDTGDRAIIGRPSKYSQVFAKQARMMCERGATDQELAEFFGVEVRTIYRWKHEHEEFCQALIVGKSEADGRVERSLYQRATGYEAQKAKVAFDKDGKVLRASYAEHVPADVSAIKFWLGNRAPDRWRERQAIEHSGPNGGPIELQARQAAISEMLAEFREAKRNGDLVIEHKPADGRDLI